MTAFLTATLCCFLALARISIAEAKSLPQSLGLPTDGEWTSLTESVEFLPASDEGSALLRREQHRFLSYYSEHFVDGQETLYNEYAQVWRLLGLFVDCDAGNAEAEQRRHLEDGGGDDADADADEDGEADENGDEYQEAQEEEQDNGEEEQQADEEEEEVEEEENDGSVCVRRLLWAAYVDLDYEGNGLSEYKIFNTASNSWDSSACEASDSKRCVKMDCHKKGTSFKPLGYFLEDAPVDFLQLLAQHQGSCTWSETRANAMDDGIEWLPQECTQTETIVHGTQGSSTYVKFDIKPKQGGGIDIGLYTDYKCSEEYVGSEVTVEEVLKNYYGFDVEAESTLNSLNEALDAFKVCTPCRTFDLAYVPGQNGNGGEDGEEENEENGGDSNNANFICNDGAGYAGVNQCMMFAQNSQKASFREVSLASQQGTILRTYASVDSSESWWQSWGFFLISLLVFALGMVCFCANAVKRKRISASDKNEPLIRQ